MELDFRQKAESRREIRSDKIAPFVDPAQGIRAGSTLGERSELYPRPRGLWPGGQVRTFVESPVEDWLGKKEDDCPDPRIITDRNRFKAGSGKFTETINAQQTTINKFGISRARSVASTAKPSNPLSSNPLTL